MEDNVLIETKKELEAMENASFLISEIKRYKEENDRLRLKQKHFYSLMAIAKKQNKLISFIRGSQSENISNQAKELFEKFWEVINIYQSEVHGKEQQASPAPSKGS